LAIIAPKNRDINADKKKSQWRSKINVDGLDLIISAIRKNHEIELSVRKKGNRKLFRWMKDLFDGSFSIGFFPLPVSRRKVYKRPFLSVYV
jgi:hypothetical protein